MSKLNQTKISISSIWGQIYILPFIKLTHTRTLNGNFELIIGWLNKEVVIGI